VTNYGTDLVDSDYPDFGHPVATDETGKADFGIVICGSGTELQ
jgi:ribose 5-phosphate isomerase RpiB